MVYRSLKELPETSVQHPTSSSWLSLQVWPSHSVQRPVRVGKSPLERSVSPSAGRRGDEHLDQPLQGWLEVRMRQGRAGGRERDREERGSVSLGRSQLTKSAHLLVSCLGRKAILVSDIFVWIHKPIWLFRTFANEHIARYVPHFQVE